MKPSRRIVLLLVLLVVVVSGSLLRWNSGDDSRRQSRRRVIAPAPTPEPQPRSAVEEDGHEAAPQKTRQPAPKALVSATASSQALLTMANDTSIPADEREARILNEAKKGGAADLMALGDAGAYFSATAVRALGQIPSAEVQAYLAGKLRDANPRVVIAAVESLAQLENAGAIPRIADTLRNNRVRADGFEDTVSGTCVEAMGRIQSPLALPVLGEELDTVVGNTLGFDHGSKVLKAIGQIGDPAAVPTLETYIEKLKAQRQVEAANPKADAYFQTKIQEAQAVITTLKAR